MGPGRDGLSQQQGSETLGTLAILKLGHDPALVGSLTVRADDDRYAVLPGVADQPPGRVQVGELDSCLATLALDLFALHRSALPLQLDRELLCLGS